MPTSIIDDLITQLVQNKYAYVSATETRALMPSNVDFDTLVSFWDETAPQRDETGQEVYPGKRSLCSYYNYQATKACCASPLGDDSSLTLEHIDPTTVHQVSNYRVHKAWPTHADTHPALVAVRTLVFDVLRGVLLQGLADTDSHYPPVEEFQAMQTAYRVIQQPQLVHGHPGPEGVHQDDATLTVIALVHRENVQGGVNRIWTLAQPNGKPTEIASSDRLLAQVLLQEHMDTLWVLDRHVKHEVTDIHPTDPNQIAIRDVLTLEVRPKKEAGRS